MRLLSGIVLTFMLIASAAPAADEKIEVKKLLGKWEPKEAKKDSKIQIEFAAEGKLTFSIESNGKDFTTSGSWSLTGAALTIIIKAGENDSRDTVTITKLTDDELHVESAKKDEKKKEIFKRVK